jgi:hypothetical protein
MKGEKDMTWVYITECTCFTKRASQAQQYRVHISCLYISPSHPLTLSLCCVIIQFLPEMDMSVFETKNYLFIPRY